MQALGEQADRMRGLLAQIGQALQSRAADGAAGDQGGRPGCGDKPGSGGASGAAQAQSQQLSFEVQLKSLLFSRAAVAEGPEAKPPAESPAL